MISLRVCLWFSEIHVLANIYFSAPLLFCINQFRPTLEMCKIFEFAELPRYLQFTDYQRWVPAQLKFSCESSFLFWSYVVCLIVLLTIPVLKNKTRKLANLVIIRKRFIELKTEPQFTGHIV